MDSSLITSWENRASSRMTTAEISSTPPPTQIVNCIVNDLRIFRMILMILSIC